MAENRVVMDCREVPSTTNCSLTLAGREDEVLKVGVRHAVEDHGDKDSPELRESLRKHLKPQSPSGEFAPTPPMA